MTDVIASLYPDHREFDVLIGSKVRGRMAEKGVTQEVVAHVLGMQQQSVSKRLTGKVPFDLYELKLVADALGMSVNEMLDGLLTGPPAPDPRHPGVGSTGDKRRYFRPTRGRSAAIRPFGRHGIVTQNAALTHAA